MLRKTMIALAAVGAMGTVALSTTQASAGGIGIGFGPGGIHVGFGGGYHKHHWHGPKFGFYAPYAYGYNCYKVVKPYGKVKLVCAY